MARKFVRLPYGLSEMDGGRDGAMEVEGPGGGLPGVVEDLDLLQHGGGLGDDGGVVKRPRLVFLCTP